MAAVPGWLWEFSCPTYVSYGEGDYAEATSREFYDRLNVSKHFEMFKDADGSGGHCEGMGQSRYYAGVFGFLNEHLAPRRGGAPQPVSQPIPGRSVQIRHPQGT